MATGDLIPPVETAAPAAVEAPVAAHVVADAPKSAHEIPTLFESLKTPGVEAPKAAPEAEKKPDAEAAPAEVKPVEVKPAEADKPAVPAQEVAKVEDKPLEGEVQLPHEYKFEFPENIKPQDEKVAAFTDFAREHNLTPEAAQKAVGFFNEAATAFVTEQRALQDSVWNDTRAEWRKEVLASPILGGASHLQAMGVVARARDAATEIISGALPGTPKYEQTAQRIENFVRVTGSGDHPVFLEILHALGGMADEPRAPKTPPAPPKNNGVRPSNSLYAPKRQ